MTKYPAISLMIVTAAALCLHAVTLHAGAGEDAPVAHAAPQPEIIQTKGPVTWYINHCARCHGDPDTAYADEPDQPPRQHARGDELRRMIREMTAAYAPVPLNDAELQSQLVLHEALFDHKPYVWIDRTIKDEQAIAGEIIPGSVVRIADTQAHISDHRFAIHRDESIRKMSLIIEYLGQTITAETDP
jgi:cytochrome c553